MYAHHTTVQESVGVDGNMVISNPNEHDPKIFFTISGVDLVKSHNFGYLIK